MISEISGEFQRGVSKGFWRFWMVTECPDEFKRVSKGCRFQRIYEGSGNFGKFWRALELRRLRTFSKTFQSEY